MIRLRCSSCGTEWNETYPKSHSMYGVCPGQNCTAPRRSKTGEPVKEAKD